jgi:hypothetical protein
METFELSDVSDPDTRRRVEEWTPPDRRATPMEKGFIAQALFALGEIARCKRFLSVLRAERERCALIRFEEKLEDEVRYYDHMLHNEDSRSAVVGLKRSAADVRYMIMRWERLERLLAEDGTWFGADMVESIQLQGFSGHVDMIHLSETAYHTWLDCVSARAHPSREDIELICAPDVVPKAVQDRGRPLWAPDPQASRARLRALVERELPALRALEAKLRVAYEEPARAAAKDVALARFPRDEAELLSAIRSHEGAYHKAVFALDRLGRRTPAPARARGPAPLPESRMHLVVPAKCDDPHVRGSDDRDGGATPPRAPGHARVDTLGSPAEIRYRNEAGATQVVARFDLPAASLPAEAIRWCEPPDRRAPPPPAPGHPRVDTLGSPGELGYRSEAAATQVIGAVEEPERPATSG